MEDLKENEEKSWFGVFYNTSTTPGFPPQSPQGAYFCIFSPILIKFVVEIISRQIWRKIKRNPDSECFITPLPPPVYHPKMLTLAFFIQMRSKLMWKSIWSSVNSRQIWWKMKTCFRVFNHPSTTPSLPSQSPQNFGNCIWFATCFDFWKLAWNSIYGR